MRRSAGRRRSWKLRGAFTLALVAVWLAGPWSAGVLAQAPVPVPANANSFPDCIRAQVETQAAALPSVDERNYFQSPDVLLAAVWACAGYYADLQMVPAGRNLLGGLVIIMTIWTGIGFMFSGQLDFGRVLGFLFLAGFAFVVLDNYFHASPAAVPWLPAGQTSNGFVALFADQAVRWGEVIIGDADEQFQQAFVRAQVVSAETAVAGRLRVSADPDRVYSDALSNADAGDAEAVAGVLDMILFALRTGALYLWQKLMSSLLWLVGWMIYAQYVWGFFTLTVLTVLGPLFVPWMMVPQLDFLFWGWFKALINGMIYMLTASALYAATAMLLVAPLQRFAEIPVPTDPGSLLGALEFGGRMVVEYVPMVIMCLFAAFKVNALSSMVVAGSTMPGSGLGSALTKASSGMRTLAGRYGAPSGASKPLSPTTSPLSLRQRVGGAYDEARRRAGVGGRRGGRGR